MGVLKANVMGTWVPLTLADVSTLVKKAGDRMSGALTIASTATSNVLWLIAGPNAGGVNATMMARNAADNANIGRLSFYEAGGTVLASMVTDEPVKLVVNNSDRLAVGPADTVSKNQVLLPGNPAAALGATPKQYVDSKIPLLYVVPGIALSGTFSGEATLATLTQTFPACIVDISFVQFIYRSVPADRFDVFIKIDGAILLMVPSVGTSYMTPAARATAVLTAGTHTITMSMTRYSGGTGNATVYADQRVNRLDVTVLPV